MHKRGYLLLALGGLAVALLAAAPQAVPGYMDAEYYYAGAQRLAAYSSAAGGYPWQFLGERIEPYLWNYLADSAVPTFPFLYWMPLVSLIGAAGLRLFSGLMSPFWAARLFLILLAASIPPLTASLARRLSGRTGLAWLAGGLALFPGFYLPYLTTTDAFAVYMVCGGWLIWLAARPLPGRRLARYAQLFGMGLLAGCMHLARADGLLWLPLVFGYIVYDAWVVLADKNIRSWLHLSPAIWPRLAAALAGYLMLMAPWYARNLALGSLFAPNGGHLMWLTAYEQTMIYPVTLLTPQAWLASGWQAIAQARWDAFVANLQTSVAVQGGTALFPFMLIGLWQLRHCFAVRLGLLAWLLTFAAMTLVFPFAGINGAYFHSGAALQPLLWAAAPLGIEAVVLWLARLRRWQRGGQVLRFLSALLVIVGLLLSAGLYVQRVMGSDSSGWAWSRSDEHYRLVEARLLELGAQPGQPVLVNNPPGYYLASGRPAMVIPYGDEIMLLDAAASGSVRWLVLEDHNSPALEALYSLHSSSGRFEYLSSVGSTRLYHIVLQGPK